jgi:hypothetical protein
MARGESDGAEVALEGESSGGDGGVSDGGAGNQGRGAPVFGVVGEIDGMDLDELAVVRQPDGAVERLTLKLDPAVGVTAGQLVGDAAE